MTNWNPARKVRRLAENPKSGGGKFRRAHFPSAQPRGGLNRSAGILNRSAWCCEEEFGKGEGADQGGVEEPTGGGSGHVGDKVAPRGGALHGHGELKDFDGAAHQEGDEEDPQGHLQGLALQRVDEKEGQDEVHADVDHLVEMGDGVEFLHGEVLRGHQAEGGDHHQP